MTDRWPWGGDSLQAKLRALASGYRAIALRADPENTAKLDVIAMQCGETWVVPHEQPYHDDALISTAEVAALLYIKRNSVSKLLSRGRLRAYSNSEKRYRAGDVYELRARIRGRKQK